MTKREMAESWAKKGEPYSEYTEDVNDLIDANRVSGYLTGFDAAIDVVVEYLESARKHYVDEKDPNSADAMEYHLKRVRQLKGDE